MPTLRFALSPLNAEAGPAPDAVVATVALVVVADGPVAEAERPQRLRLRRRPRPLALRRRAAAHGCCTSPTHSHPITAVAGGPTSGHSAAPKTCLCLCSKVGVIDRAPDPGGRGELQCDDSLLHAHESHSHDASNVT